jgi:hypothetical protein
LLICCCEIAREGDQSGAEGASFVLRREIGPMVPTVIGLTNPIPAARVPGVAMSSRDFDPWTNFCSPSRLALLALDHRLDAAGDVQKLLGDLLLSHLVAQ